MTEKKIKESEGILNKELSLNDLDEVSGGKIKISGYALLTAMMVQVKALGKDKEHCIQILKKSWETDSAFKTAFTDQTGEDLNKAIESIDRNWK